MKSAARLWKVRHDAEEISRMQAEHGEVAQRPHGILVSQRIVRQQEVLPPNVPTHQDLAGFGCHTRADDAQGPLDEDVLVRNVSRQRQTPRQKYQDASGHRVQVPHLAQPILVKEVCKLSLQLRGHVLDDVLLTALPRDVYGVVEIPPELLARILRNIVVQHQPVQVVHRPAEVYLVRVHRGDDAADCADNVGPHASRQRRAERRDPILLHGLGGDIAIADTRKGDHCPVQGNCVNLKRPIIHIFGPALANSNSLQPTRTLSTHGDPTP
mmetsp:Transcript_114520/g.330837  ORF Transcript_114520/g.330837 Transcript_114520/m.330837 type:complete len:269 (-) Transcript_114520:730-1536(-)